MHPKNLHLTVVLTKDLINKKIKKGHCSSFFERIYLEHYGKAIRNRKYDPKGKAIFPKCKVFTRVSTFKVPTKLSRPVRIIKL